MKLYWIFSDFRYSDYKMYYVLKRDPSLHWCYDIKTPVCEESLLIADDGSEVSIPTVVLLAASPVLMSMVDTSFYSPPMALSITGVSRDVLLSVCKILTTGEVKVKNNTEDEVKMAMTMLGIDLSLHRYQIANCGQGNVNDDQDKTDCDEVKIKSNLKEAKLEIFVKLGEYVERESGNNVGREFEDCVKPEFELSYEGEEMKDERSSDYKEHSVLKETDNNNDSESKDEDHVNCNGRGEKNAIPRKRKRVLRFDMKDDKVKVYSRSTERNSNRNRRKTKRKDLCIYTPDTYSPDVYDYDDSSVNCDGCEACPIRSEIYKCTDCEDYDLCSSCKESFFFNFGLQRQPRLY